MRPRSGVIGEKQMRFHERMIMLSVLDGLWKDHLLNMDHLKEGIGLRGYAQQDPLVAYKKESFDMFEGMMGRFQEDTVRYLFLMQIVGPDGRAGRDSVEASPRNSGGAGHFSRSAWTGARTRPSHAASGAAGAPCAARPVDHRCNRARVPAQEAARAPARANGRRRRRVTPGRAASQWR